MKVHMKIEEVVSSLLPDDEYRKICLSLFAQSLIKANSYGRNKWGVYYRSEGIRLLVGGIIVFTIHKDGIWLSLDRRLLNEAIDQRRLLDETRAWQWDKNDYPEYKRVPSRNGYYTPSADDAEIWSVIRNFHFEHIKNVAEKYPELISPSQRTYDPALLVYLRKELGQAIPEPDYGPQIEDNPIQDVKEFEITYRHLPKTQRESLILGRIGQGAFRSDLEKYWKKCCAVTGCELSKVLIASHIKPWRSSDNTERLDVYNGLLLLPNLDSAFDKGYISFDNQGKIMICDSLNERDRNKLGIHSEMKLRKIEEHHLKYLDYHRQNVFSKL
jgi:5-methylcytosine-specific restriction protein A